MNRFLILLLITFLAFDVSAQRRRRKTPPPPTPEELAEQARKERYERSLNAIERVTFIDSVLLSKKELMDVLSLGKENGSVHSRNAFFAKQGGNAEENTQAEDDTLDCTLFQTQLRDKIVFTQQGTDSILHLYASEKIAGRWTDPVLLPGLRDTVDHNYPFMMSDGVTLYYAAKDPSGLGGYDILMTRWDADKATFLKPSGIGMPFNSEGNDYLYVVDEFNQLGWFVTDRGLPADTVCLYCFIPNEARRIYNANELGRDTLVSLAAIHSIRDTWTDETAVKEALGRLKPLRSTARTIRKADFRFVVNDLIVYTDLSQFRQAESKKLAAQWVSRTKELEKVSQQLDTLRKQYSAADATTRTKLKSQLLSLEQQYETLIPAIARLEKEMRLYEQR